MPDARHLLADTERWFIRRGTPHLIDQYSASGDVFTRATPILLLVFLFSMFGAGNLDWPWWQNALAVSGGFVVLLGVWAAANRLRHRPTFAAPDQVGAPELVAFVGGPSLLQLLSGQPAAAAGTAGMLLVLLGGLYLVTSYGLVPMTRWAFVETIAELHAVLGLLLRALPLLLLVVTFLFINAELWDIAANVPGPFFAVVVGMFALVGLLFLVSRLPSEFEALVGFDTPEELSDLLAGTPLAHADPAAIRAATGRPLELGSRQRLNLLLVALFSQGLQIVLVGVLIGTFFVVLGLFGVSGVIIEHWTGHPGDALVETALWGHPLVLHAELLRTAGFLGAFSALHFTVTLITDDTYRREFLDAVLIEIRQTLAVRAVYRVLKTGPS